MRRTNDGFNPMELLGMMKFVSMEIKQQIEGSIKPKKIFKNI
jgi:hypothetical protein